MKTVYKYPLVGSLPQVVVVMPKGAEVLTVQVQNGDICLWALVDSEAATEARKFVIVGTGHPVPPNGSYVGTVQMGAFVWHVFEYIL